MMINLFKVNNNLDFDAIHQHYNPLPRNFDMRTQRIFNEFFDGLDWKQFISPKYIEARYNLENNQRDWVWYNRIENIIGLWTNHRIYQLEVDQGRMNDDDIDRCQLCGKFDIKNGMRIRDVFGSNHCICRDCQRYWWCCDECGEYHFGNESRLYVGGSSVCDQCFVKLRDEGALASCSVCGSDVYTEELLVVNNHQVCYVCQDERLLSCEGCGRELIDGLDRMIWVEDDPFCSDCYNEMAVVAQYDHYVDNPPILSLSGERVRGDTLLFGLEFEIEHGWNEFEVPERVLGKTCLESVNKEWGYCKHDGSIHRGVEWVSHPMTPLFYKANRKEFDKVLNGWAASGFRTDQWDDEGGRYNCGLHIHMSKAAFGSAHLYKFVRFFYKMHLRKLVQQVAERDANYYAQYNPDDFENGAKLAKQKANVSGNRYSVINLIGGHWHEDHGAPSKTVEFRLFKGTLDPKKLHKNIEFLLSVYFFTRDNSITHITEKNYLRFLGQTKNKWRYLTDFLRNQLGKEC